MRIPRAEIWSGTSCSPRSTRIGTTQGQHRDNTGTTHDQCRQRYSPKRRLILTRDGVLRGLVADSAMDLVLVPAFGVLILGREGLVAVRAERHGGKLRALGVDPAVGLIVSGGPRRDRAQG